MSRLHTIEALRGGISTPTCMTLHHEVTKCLATTVRLCWVEVVGALPMFFCQVAGGMESATFSHCKPKSEQYSINSPYLKLLLTVATCWGSLESRALVMILALVIFVCPLVCRAFLPSCFLMSLRLPIREATLFPLMGGMLQLCKNVKTCNVLVM
jgi:hypothetical protein